jgi:hypothetical protein
MAIVGLVVAIGVVYVVATTQQSEEASRPAGATATRMANEDFLRLNTTDLEYPSPATVAAVVTPREKVDPFIHMNTTALDGLVPASATGESSGIVTEEFLEWNTSSLEYAPARYSESASGPQ